MSQVAEVGDVIVIDNGTANIKTGLAGQNKPKAVFPTQIGTNKHQLTMVGQGVQDTYIGNASQTRRSILNTTNPIDRGVVTNWDAMEKIWKYTMETCVGVDPESHPVLLTEVPNNDGKHRFKLYETMFETFNIPALYVTYPGLLSLYASGCTTGTVIDVGHGVTHVIPVYCGYNRPSTIERHNIGGQDITNYLTLLLKECGCRVQNITGMKEISKHIKETLCDTHMATSVASRHQVIPRTYTLPDGTRLQLNSELKDCCEVLFQPTILGKDGTSIAHMLQKSIMACDIDCRKSLYKNIILAGGSSLFKGFQLRLEDELASLKPSGARARVRVHPNRDTSAWIGGSILAAMSPFNTMWVTKQQFYESGYSAIPW